MNWSASIRRFHRWLSVAFTVGFIANVVAMWGGAEPPFWVYLLALVPLFLLFPTGLYMFVQPYAARWRTMRHIPQEQ